MQDPLDYPPKAEGKREPAIGENMGLPKKLFDGKEAKVVGEASFLLETFK